MDDMLINRLSKFIEQIKRLTSDAHDLVQGSADQLESTNVLIGKLKKLLSMFQFELCNYFKLCQNPDADAISEFTTNQLLAEQTLSELETRSVEKTPAPVPRKETEQPMSYSKLPDLNLPEFSGDLLQWHQFWDQFSSNIDRRNLNDVDKLLYLKGSLKGEAARLVDGFDTTNRSFQLAVDTLKSRYGKTHEIIYAHHKALNEVKRAENMEECRITLDAIERHLRVLKSLGEITDTSLMRILIMGKFPREMVYEVKMRLGSEAESVENIVNKMALIITTNEEASRMTSTLSQVPSGISQYTVETLHTNSFIKKDKPSFLKNNSNSHNNMKQNKKYNNLKSKFNNDNFRPQNRPVKRKFENHRNYNAEKRKKWSCIFCSGTHTMIDCERFRTIEERKGRLYNRCFCCLKLGHAVFMCPTKRNCEHCGKLHHKSLCPSKVPMKRNKEIASTTTSTRVMHANQGCSTMLQTAVVKVKGHDGIMKTCRILLDCGSQRSYITQKMAKELNLKTEEENNLAIFTFGSQSPKELQSPLVKLEMMARNGSSKTIFANVVPSISQSVPHPEGRMLDQQIRKKYVLADDGSLSDKVDILLGNDYYFTVILMNKVCIGQDLYLVESEFGWLLSGPIVNEPTEKLAVLTYFQSSCDIGLNKPDPPLSNDSLKFLWDLESIGITDSPKLNRDEEAVKHFNETTEFKDNRYYVSWPWNGNQSDLPSNFGLAYGRLVNLLKRLDSATLQVYNQTLTDQMEKGVIEEVPQKVNQDHPIHYIPHHGVSVPGKALRIVYDASAKIKDKKSLNEHLYCGPILLEDLTELIIKFRCYPIGLTADVEKAFLQVGLQEPDRDVTRFLWLKNLNEPATESNLLHLRFTRVPFGIISSPFMLNATIKHHLLMAEKESVRRIAKDIYVDNLVTGVNNVKEALDLYHDSKETFNQISMNLREWSSNSKKVLQKIPDACPDKVVKVLGLNWHLQDDTLHLRTKLVKNPNTKRGILKTVASMYDPCGYVVPTLLSAKLLLQDLWKMKLKWDAPLPEDITNKWNDIQQHFEEIKDVNLSRCFLDNIEDNDCQLHCFTDSSTRAYAASVYIVGKNQKSFVMGKSRLVPIKDQEHLKIPRLELLGVLIGSRLMQYVRKCINRKVKKQILWTDSQIVIDWLKSNKLLTPFVSRRVEEIKKNKDLIFRYVPSELNPADVATRPTDLKSDREKWLSGPDFLLQESSSWPTSTIRQDVLLAGEVLTSQKELSEEPMESEVVMQNPNELQEESMEIEDVHSDHPKDVIQEQDLKFKDSTLEEIKKVQSEHFKEEINDKITSLSRNLGLFKDVDGVLRCKGRLKYAEWSFDKRYPVLIPKDCVFTNKIIQNTHEKNYHVGVNHTLSIIRQCYWIPQGKRQVRKILNKCPRCVKHGGGPFKLPPTPALPHERVSYSKPFTFTGVDYLGPVLVKTESGTRKRWICLFTCLAVRAVHLEVVEDLSAEEGLLALRRMISTRGVPTLITSDNALYFKLIADIVANKYCVENKIKWRFIPELAPWHGGFYERLVGLVKNCMRRTLQKHMLKDNQLLTIIKEIEAVINTRPLTSVDTEVDHILKPSDFLQAGRCFTLDTSQESAPVQGTSTKVNLIEGWRKARVILEEFTQMFQNQYLPSLRERYSHSHKQPRVVSKLTPTEGQIVQIKGDNKNRESWKVGKITNLVKGADGLVRVAHVKVGDSTFTRSIAHLFPLELEDNISQNSVVQDVGETVPQETDSIILQDLDKAVPNEIVEKPREIIRDLDETDKVSLVGNEVETLVGKERENTENEVLTNASSIDVPSSTEPEIEIESIDKITDDQRDNSVELSVDSTPEGQLGGSRPRRLAAVRALEKIREWTHNLAIILL